MWWWRAPARRRGSPRLALRGSNPDEVLIYVDGVPLNIAEGGGVDISTLPLGDVERVEVYRGTTPLAFGEAALGGVVSITTRTPGATPRPGARGGRLVRDDVRRHLGRGARRPPAVLSRRARLFVAGRLPVPLQPAAGTPGRRGRAIRQNNDALEGNGVLRLALTLNGRRTLSLGAIGFGREQGLPGPVPAPYVPATARFHSARGLGYLRYESRDDLGPGGRLSAQAFVSVERDRLIDPAGDLFEQGPLITHETTISTGVTANATRPLGDWGRAAAVLEARRETYTPDNEVDPTHVGRPRPAAGRGGGRRARPALAPSGPSRHSVGPRRADERRRHRRGQQRRGAPRGAAVFRALPIYRLGLVRPLNESATFKGNVGRYARAPSFLELYGNGNDRLLGRSGLAPRARNQRRSRALDRPRGTVGGAAQPHHPLRRPGRRSHLLAAQLGRLLARREPDQRARLRPRAGAARDARPPPAPGRAGDDHGGGGRERAGRLARQADRQLPALHGLRPPRADARPPSCGARARRPMSTRRCSRGLTTIPSRCGPSRRSCCSERD